jgi:hypothetical protein
MAPGSPLELYSLWKTLLETGEIDGATRTHVEHAFVAADRLPIGIALNDRPLTGRDVYFAYSEGRCFGDNEDAKRLLDELSIAPMPELLRMALHGVCANYAGLVFVLLDVILRLERAHARP